jgi:hypothetical protein
LHDTIPNNPRNHGCLTLHSQIDDHTHVRAAFKMLGMRLQQHIDPQYFVPFPGESQMQVQIQQIILGFYG